jgi:DNA modification methylase
MLTNQVIIGDSAEVLSTFQDDCIDLTVTSPPYDNLRTYDSYKSFDFPTIATQLFRVTKPGGVVVWVVGDATINGSETGTSFRQALYFMDCRFRLHDTMIYKKKNYIPLTHNRYEQAWEYMFVFSKDAPKTWNPIMIPSKFAGNEYNLSRKGYCATITEGAQRRRDENVKVKNTKIHSNIFTYTCGSMKVGHPAPFPMDLPKDHILSWSNHGDIILDCFAGSGTTLCVAKTLGREYIGIELSADYVNKIILPRLAATPVPLGLQC